MFLPQILILNQAESNWQAPQFVSQAKHISMCLLLLRKIALPHLIAYIKDQTFHTITYFLKAKSPFQKMTNTAV